MSPRLDNYYRRIRSLHPNINQDIGIVLSRNGCTSPEKGMTMSELRAAYKTATESDFPIKGEVLVQLNFVLTVPYVAAFTNHRGTYFLYNVEPCKFYFN